MSKRQRLKKFPFEIFLSNSSKMAEYPNEQKSFGTVLKDIPFTRASSRSSAGKYDMRSTVMCEPSSASFFLTTAVVELNFSAFRKCSQSDSKTFKYQDELLESSQKERLTMGWTVSPNDAVSEMFEIGDVKRQIFVSNDPTGNVRWHWPRHFVIREFTHVTTTCFLFLSAVAESESNRLDSTKSTDSDKSKMTSSLFIGPT